MLRRNIELLRRRLLKQVVCQYLADIDGPARLLVVHQRTEALVIEYEVPCAALHLHPLLCDDVRQEL